MPDPTDLYPRAAAGFGRCVAAVTDANMHDPTPCTDWDVRQLVNHLVNENRWVPPLLEGQTIADVGDRFDGDLVGDDPDATWADAVAGASAAVSEPGVLERTVHVSFGDISGAEYLSQIVSDHVIHGWDLARAVGADEALDPELVQFVYDFMAPQVDQWRAAGVFGPAVDVPADADLATRLLAITGRRA
jgi:uncharacterized protein (TIGR03086 family)